MIYSDACYLRQICNKYNNVKNCECKNDTIFCQKLFRIDYLLNESLLSDYQKQRVELRLDADNTDKDIFVQLKNIENDIENFVNSGKSLYLYSATTGNGKTAWSIRLLQSYINNIWYKSDLCCKALYINVPRFLLTLKNNINSNNLADKEYIEHIQNNILKADLVIWDEIGSKVATQYELDNLLSMINLRVDNNKTNIYTSNLFPQQLTEYVGARLSSRIMNLSLCFNFQGKDKRCLQSYNYNF